MPQTPHPLAKKLRGPENGGGKNAKSKPQTQNPKREPDWTSCAFPWTDHRARKQLPMPSRDLSNFSSGGRTGYTERLSEKTRAGRWICFGFAWKTRCSPKPCAPQSLENAQRSGGFYQQKRLNANLPFLFAHSNFPSCCFPANAQLKQISQGKRSRAPYN